MAEIPDRVRRRIDEIFGDVLPAVTRDEVGERRSPADDAAARADEEWLRANRPPHHDRD